MPILRLAMISLSVLFSACATTSFRQKTTEEQYAYHIEQVEAAVGKGECSKAGQHFEIISGFLDGKKKIKSDQKTRDCYYSYYSQLISSASLPLQVNGAYTKLLSLKVEGVFSDDEIASLFALLQKRVVDGNETGAVPFVLGDNVENFPELKTPLQQKLIVDRTIENLQNGSLNRQVAELMRYVSRVGINSPEGKRIEALLPSMKIRREEIEVVGQIFPKFSAARSEEIMQCVYVQVKNGDRLLLDDLIRAFRSKVRGVRWVQSAVPKCTILTIERVRNDEKSLPERTQTITYAQHEVSFLAGALLMPRNASYLYEVVSWGNEINYGYVVTAVVDGKVVCDEVVRGKVEAEYSRCQNARIQNVFGGVSSAEFVANDDMQRRCSIPSPVSMEVLRDEVLSKIALGVLKVPSIKSAHELN